MHNTGRGVDVQLFVGKDLLAIQTQEARTWVLVLGLHGLYQLPQGKEERKKTPLMEYSLGTKIEHKCII